MQTDATRFGTIFKTLKSASGSVALFLAIPALLYVFNASESFATISAGVAVFLFGMRFMEAGFQAFTGGMLENILKACTTGRIRSLLFGVVSTTIMQSSSLVSVITISFLSAGLINLAAGIGIVFGANLGTTTGAWLIAAFGLKVKISAYAMPMLALGIILVFLPSKKAKGAGDILAGLGFIFLGIAFMKDGFDAFSQGFDLTQIQVEGLQGILLFVLFGALATVIMQSSHATLVLILTALAAGQIDFQAAIALSIGANVGTTITAIIGALSANIQGKRLAVAHLFFNVVTGTIIITTIEPTLVVVETLSDFLGFSDTDATLKLALFHTLFNSLGVLLLTPLIPAMIPYLKRLMPVPRTPGLQPMYLTAATEAFPETLNTAMVQELARLYDNAIEIMAHGLHFHRRILFSHAPLHDAIKTSNDLITIDLDDQYAQRVESLSSAILETITRNVTRHGGDLEHLRAYQSACRSIVTCVKETKHLRPNLTQYIHHKNPYIRDKYNHLRVSIGDTIRAIDIIRNEPETTRETLGLEAIRVKFMQDDASASGELEAMIRDGKITARMGMSLLNDLRYTQSIIWALIDIARILFGETEEHHTDAERMLNLNEDDLSRLARGKS